MVQVVAGAYVEDLEPAILILSCGGLEGAAADGKLRTPYNTGHHTLSFEQPRLIESARRSSSTSGSPSRGRRDTIGHLGGSVQAVIRRSVAVPSINRRMQCFAMPAGKRYNRFSWIMGKSGDLLGPYPQGRLAPNRPITHSMSAEAVIANFRFGPLTRIATSNV
jgi:hypothetical protein